MTVNNFRDREDINPDLANGNRPLALEELSRQLREQRGGDSYRTSVEVLPRLLKSDQYYGLRQVAS